MEPCEIPRPTYKLLRHLKNFRASLTLEGPDPSGARAPGERSQLSPPLGGPAFNRQLFTKPEINSSQDILLIWIKKNNLYLCLTFHSWMNDHVANDSRTDFRKITNDPFRWTYILWYWLLVNIQLVHQRHIVTVAFRLSKSIFTEMKNL